MFVLTLNMPARSGATIHQVYAEHKAENLHEFLMALEEGEFIIIEEQYRKSTAGRNEFFLKGPTLINTRFIGKVSIFNSSKEDY